jgi:hypothetical protein
VDGVLRAIEDAMAMHQDNATVVANPGSVTRPAGYSSLVDRARKRFLQQGATARGQARILPPSGSARSSSVSFSA